MNQAIIRKAHQGEVNFLWADLPYIIKDLGTGESFAIAGHLIKENGLSEGDIVQYNKEPRGVRGEFTINISRILIPMFWS